MVVNFVSIPHKGVSPIYCVTAMALIDEVQSSEKSARGDLSLSTIY